MSTGGTRLSRAVVGDQRVGVEPELLERALLELLDAHPLLGPGHLVAVHGVDQLVELLGQVAQPARGRAISSSSRPRRACSTRGPLGPRRPRSRPRAARGRPRRRGRPPRRPGPRGRSRSRRASGAGPGLPLGLGGPSSESARPAQRAGPLLGGAQREPGVHLGLAAGAGRPRRAARASAVSGSSSGASSAAASRCSSSARPARSRSRASSAPAIAAVTRSASPLADRASEPSWPSSSATAASVASDSCSLASATSTRCCAWARSSSSRDRSKPSRSQAWVASPSCSVGLVDRGLHLDQAGLRRRAAGGEVRAEQVAVAGDRGDVRQRRPPAARAASRSSTTATLNSSRRQRRPQGGGALDDVDGVGDVRRAGPGQAPVVDRVPAAEQRCRPGRGPRSCRCSIAPTAASTCSTATASAAAPSAAATAVS